VKACHMQRAVGLDSFLGRGKRKVVVVMTFMGKRMDDLMEAI